MKTVAVINGEDYWPEYLPGFHVVKRRLQETQWILKQGRLWVIDQTGGVALDGILWRVGAIRPQTAYRTALEIIRLSEIPCVNTPEVLLRGYDRLSMLYELKKAGLPLNRFDIAVGDRMIERITPDFPTVVKVGNYHGGFGKALANTEEQWNDVVNLCFASEDYATVEPYIEYVRDIRCLAVGEQLWGMSRQGRYWKANQLTAAYAGIALPEELVHYTQMAMKHFGADVLGLDFLEDKEGHYVLLESNDVPGLAGFPEEVRAAVAETFRRKID